MITCPNCGSQNENVSRFCGECGADLRSLRASASDSPSPPTSAFGNTQSQSQPGNWQSTTGLPETPKKGRRVWLWIVIGILALCLAVCCGFGVWANTDSGRDTLSDWGTGIADYATEVAPTPTPRR